jgi:hypothetical protein
MFAVIVTIIIAIFFVKFVFPVTDEMWNQYYIRRDASVHKETIICMFDATDNEAMKLINLDHISNEVIESLLTPDKNIIRYLLKDVVAYEEDYERIQWAVLCRYIERFSIRNILDMKDEFIDNGYGELWNNLPWQPNSPAVSVIEAPPMLPNPVPSLYDREYSIFHTKVKRYNQNLKFI